jgi:hypothetical protein
MRAVIIDDALPPTPTLPRKGEGKISNLPTRGEKISNSQRGEGNEAIMAPDV